MFETIINKNMLSCGIVMLHTHTNPFACSSVRAVRECVNDMMI